MKVFLRTLTPLHIGTGESLHSLDYVLQDGHYYRVSQAQFTRFLGSLPNPEAIIEKFVSWIGDITDKLENLEYQYKSTQDSREKRDYNQQLRDLRKQLQLDIFCKANGVGPAFTKYLNDPKSGIRKYKLNGNTKQQVRGLITTATNELYLPGTTLKGSIRTAMMYQVMADEYQQGKRKHKDKLIQDINTCLADRTMRPMELRKKMGRELEFSIAFCGMVDRRNKTVFDDEKMDLFKFVEVSDAVYVSGERPVEVVASDLYLVSKADNSFGQANRNAPKVALKQPQSPGLEAIRPGIVFRSDISVNVPAMYTIYTKLPNPDKRLHWIDMEEKAKALFGIDLHLINSTNVADYQAKAENFVHQAIQRFAVAQANFDRDQWVEKQMLSRDFDRDMPEKKAFRRPFDAISNYPHNGRTLLRTGFATGFAGKTELLPMLLDDELRVAFKKVMVKLELGKRPGVRDAKPYEGNLETFPKSRLLVTYPDKSISPLGWVEYIPESEWEKVKDLKANIGAEAIPVDTKPVEAVKPQYIKGQIKKGSVLDAFVFKVPGKVPGPEKKVRVYVGKDKDVDLQIRYQDNGILGQIILVEVASMDGDNVTGVKFKGMKKENRLNAHFHLFSMPLRPQKTAPNGSRWNDGEQFLKG